MNDAVLRENLVKLLRGGQAHVSAKQALAGIKPEVRTVRPPAGAHSVWESLEHMRIAQEDILRYTLDPLWKSPEWPDGYWPKAGQEVTDEMWEASVAGFFSVLEEVLALVRNPRIDLTAEISHGKRPTYLREIFLVADHNAYHLAQIIQTRKMLNDWSDEG